MICAGFMGGQGALAGSIAYSVELSPSLKSVPSGGNTVPDVLIVLNDQGGQNGRYKQRHGDTARADEQSSADCADKGHKWK